MNTLSNLKKSETKRYKLSTEKNNQIIVEEVNKSEIDNVWQDLSELASLF